MSQCPTCGRVAEDWTTKPDGQKVRGRKDNEDRTVDYTAWRRKWNRSSYVSDIDQVEWRVRDGQIIPVAVLELTRLDGDMMPRPAYFDAIINRFTKRDGQAKSITLFSKLLGVDAIIVLFHYNLENFWLYNLSTSSGWFHLKKEGYRKWLESK